MLTPPPTYCLFVIIFVYAFSMLVSASSPLEGFLLFEPTTLLDFGAASPKSIWQGQIRRILTAPFVHGGFLHLFFNLFVLRQIGPRWNRRWARLWFLLLFLATGLGSFSFSLYMNGQLAVGASGGPWADRRALGVKLFRSTSGHWQATLRGVDRGDSNQPGHRLVDSHR